MKKNTEYNYNIKQNETFKKDLKNIYLYIDEILNKKTIAINLINMITKKIKILNYFPFANKLLKKNKNFEYRKLIIKNYIIIYKINLKEKEINILHIYNQKVNYTN